MIIRKILFALLLLALADCNDSNVDTANTARPKNDGRVRRNVQEQKQQLQTDDFARFLHEMADKLASCNCNCRECWSTGQALLAISLSFVLGAAFVRVMYLCGVLMSDD